MDTPHFCAALFKIIFVNILLSGDNAIVIALSCRSLPKQQKNKAIFWGTLLAVVMRVILTSFAAFLLSIPYLKLAGSLLLVWIAVKFLLPEEEGAGGVEAASKFVTALRTIVIADLVMSLDNVVGVAAAAEGRIGLLVIGLLMSVPLVIYGSNVVLRLLSHFPIVVVLGAALLGYIAGEMVIAEDLIASRLAPHLNQLKSWIPWLIAMSVVLAGKLLGMRRMQKPLLSRFGSEASRTDDGL